MSSSVAERYLELIKQSLNNELYGELEAQLLYAVSCAAVQRPMPLDQFQQVRRHSEWNDAIARAKADGTTIQLQGIRPDGSFGVDPRLRNYSSFAHTLVGRRRLDHLQAQVESIVDDGVPGDLLEAGVWRGGCCVLMKAVLEARGDRGRKVWLADSFRGLPAPSLSQDQGYRMDAGVLPFLAVSREEVSSLFQRYGLLDDNVRFLEGWFRDTLPGAPIERLALLRIDADLYESTRDALVSLFPRVSPGGFVVIDDYHILPPCRAAVDDYLSEHGIRVELEDIDNEAVAFRKPIVGDADR